MSSDLTADSGSWDDGKSTPAVWRASRRVNRTRLTFVALLAIGSLYVAAMAVRIYVRKYYVFLPGYISWAATPGAAHQPTDVFFMYADHFEPNYDATRVRGWAARYRQLVAHHRDHEGRAPQHTFFYPGEQVTPEIFETLRGLVSDGLGEVELHYHHDFDTEKTFRIKLESAIREFQRFGFLRTIDGKTQFAFIHGNWGLDNSNGALFCGVNKELRLLRGLGCFADFTFPSIYEESQPPFVNTIYAAKDDDHPKSYERRLPLTALRDGAADLMIFEGPLVFRPSLAASRLFLDLDDGNIHMAAPVSPTRVDSWVRADVHVDGRPDWVFIKVHGHGVSSAEDMDATLGPDFDRGLSYLERTYNDGLRYRLHYITAREAYNLARAAAERQPGEPKQYYNWIIQPYAAHPAVESDILAHTSTQPQNR